MKLTIDQTPIPVDRVATPDEILAAVLPFPDPVQECAAGILSDIASDLGGYMRIPRKDLEASLMVEELIQKDETLPN